MPEINTILELEITSIHSQGGRLGSPVSIVLQVETRIIRTKTGEVLESDTYQYTSLGRKLPEWAANEAEAVYLAYERALHGIASEIVHENFLLYTVPPSLIPKKPVVTTESSDPLPIFEEVDNDTPEEKSRGLNAWKPTWDGSYQVKVVKPLKKHIFTIAKPGSLTPHFRWKAFPQEMDRERDPERVIAGIDSVVYDLEIYNISDEIPREVVHFRHGLTETEYRMESDLEECRKYAWSVRARFNSGPYMRATDWTIDNIYAPGARYVRSRYRHPDEVAKEKGDKSIFNPRRHYYIFKTPCLTQDSTFTY